MSEQKKGRRPGRAAASGAFGRLGQATAEHPIPQGVVDTSTPRHRGVEAGAPVQATASGSDTAVSSGALEVVRRFTVRLYSHTEAERMDDWVRAARRRLGVKVDQARVVRELLRIVADDPALTARVEERLREPERHTR